eukprot:CAMPEP_0117548600 /NCGR_PEP_ID=MMETSP0784-20121206/47733_1 /TAXON_ID=39447 /ORGANISM="" /LENGTH=562 /DNA_ID=CAMNT_0005345561 /DNA_START=59 /DNA_END=1747 /DNA_ORIENTATION=-
MSLGKVQKVVTFNEQFSWLIPGQWFDSIGNAIVVCAYPGGQPKGFKVTVMPVMDHPSIQHRVLSLWHDPVGSAFRRGWRCGSAWLELADEKLQRVVWITEDGRRTVWSRVSNSGVNGGTGAATSSRPARSKTVTRGQSACSARALEMDPLHHASINACNPKKGLPVNAGSCNSIRASLGTALANNEAAGAANRRAPEHVRHRRRNEQASRDTNDGRVAFPWMHNDVKAPVQPCGDVPDDILWDGARVATLLDIRQMIGARSEPQERLTHILMDYDLTAGKDFLVPCETSQLWRTLQVPEGLRRNIIMRVMALPHEAMSHHVSWSGDSEVWVGHHRIDLRARSLDVQALKARWIGRAGDPQLDVEMARLLALYSVLDNPLSMSRTGLHLGLSPEVRQLCDYELFASPFNAVVPNGRYASKWPHVEWRFGSMGKYPMVLSDLEVDSVVCVNPPFTDAYLSDVMERLAELKLRFRLRFAMPIQEAAWRKKLQKVFPSAQLQYKYFDASSGITTNLCHPTLFWEDPRCPVEVQEVVRQDQFEADNSRKYPSHPNGWTDQRLSPVWA